MPGMKSESMIIINGEYGTWLPHGGMGTPWSITCWTSIVSLSPPGTGQGLSTAQCEEGTGFSSPSSSLGGSRFVLQGHWVSMKAADVGCRGRAAW